jgi:hypothetical protein
MAPELSRPQNPSVTASLNKDNTKAASSSVIKPQVPLRPPVTDAQGTSASLEVGAKTLGSRYPLYKRLQKPFPAIFHRLKSYL